MKVSVPNDYGTKNKNKIVLPLVPEQVEVAAKADLAQVDLLSDPNDTTSTKVKFAFKIIEGAVNPPREVLQWRRNVERAFVGLSCTTGTAQHQMVQQFCRGTALSTYNNAVDQLYLNGKANDIKAQKMRSKPMMAQTHRVSLIFKRQLSLPKRKLKKSIWQTSEMDIIMVEQALNHMMTTLLPNKILQRVKRYLRREARKPYDMDVKTYYMHIQRINGEEIPHLPPNFEKDQSLGKDEIVDILLFGTPKSWQKEMDRQGFDPLVHEPNEVVDFMERIENAEEHDHDKKTVKVAAKNDKKRNGNNNNNKNDSNGTKGSKYCMLHGNNNTHDTTECKSLQAHAKKLKDEKGSNGKSKNKSWQNKSKQGTDDSKKELAALTKRVDSLVKAQELNAIEPVKKRKVNWPEEDDELDMSALDIELKDFNYSNLDQMDITGAEEKEDGEVNSISDEVSV